MTRKNKKKKVNVSGNFTTAENLVSTFLKVTGPRQKAKAQGNSKFAGDAGYWDGGRCEWGGSHKLDEDAEVLANFFNNIANITDDINNIKLSANEQIFNTNKQQLIAKLQGLISKCRITSSTSIGNICCIWNDFFGNFLKKFLDNFLVKLQRNLTAVEKLEPKHQKELLDLEKEAREAESAYKENLQKADNETDPDKKAEFIILANRASKKAEEIKRKVKNNPIAQLANFNYLDDLRALAQGNVPPNVCPDGQPGGSGSNSNNNGGGSGSGQTPNPLEDPKSFFTQNKTMIVVVLGLVGLLLYLFLQKDDESNEDIKEEKKFMRQMAMMKMMNEKNNSPNEK